MRKSTWVASALMLLGVGPGQAVVQPVPAAERGGSQCSSLAAEPVRYDIVFEVDILPIIESSQSSGGCRDCHVNNSFGDLNMRFDVVRENLLGPDGNGQPSAQDATRLRVRPGRPQDSLIFEKLNCDIPPVGGRMPPGSSGENTALQAVVFDWIAAGALMDGGDRIFYGTMDELR